MISVPHALQILKDNLPAPRIVNMALEQTLSHRLAEDIHAPEPSPRYTNSAMDGFALRWHDVSDIGNTGPVTLKIAGESQAGIPYTEVVGSAQAIRVSTGAMIPTGCDVVVRVEDADDLGHSVVIHRCRKQWQDIRRRGEEFEQGTKILAKGLVLKARQIALLSALGLARVAVYDTPRVSLFITGTELARHDDKQIDRYQVRDANAPMLQSSIIEAGGRVIKCLHVEDDLATTITQMAKVVNSGCDLILCSGGVSVGNHDHVKQAAEAIGFKELFWKIKQKPGKPLYVAKKNETLLFGLPGNPVSAFMCFQNFVMPTLAALQGEQLLKKSITAMAENMVCNTGKRTDFLRVGITDTPNATPTFRLLERQGSHMLTSIVDADGYVAIEPGFSLHPGELTEVYMF
ncbi:molybdopterin molybdotransferase MoeA [Desulforhopalus singaporensis]|uniref:Molybdopterin molybdenumtransferase n=1 Tax=Desulforhopalus singaporensis TaxID=91360 RepID=A0A1H0IVQ1_9BACT|nr:gephyrin-like molybdotransferase Glp [Desulforhopalus singaporensis]SDO35517.1 molybdopterin molybdotransferase [Desulforhopalus singaporensis]